MAVEPCERQMRKIIFAGLAVLMIIGFFRLSRKDQGEVLETSQRAAGVAGKMIGSGYELLTEKARGLDPNSTETQLRDAKRDLEVEKAKAQGSGKSAEKVKEIQTQIDRLQSALEVRDLKNQIDARISEAAKAKENAEKTTDQVKEALHRMDAGFRALQDKLDEAQHAFTEADHKLKG